MVEGETLEMTPIMLNRVFAHQHMSIGWDLVFLALVKSIYACAPYPGSRPSGRRPHLMCAALAVVPILTHGPVLAQGMAVVRVDLLSGSFGAIKNERMVDVEFVYDHMSISGGLTNQQYVSTQTEALNRKEPGRGDQWAMQWLSDREGRYHPKFLMEYNTKMGSRQKARLNADAAQYRLVVKLLNCEPGGVFATPTQITASVVLVEVKTPESVMGEAVFSDCRGSEDLLVGYRLARAYGTLGMALAKWLKKEQWK